jgi:Zn-dependent protease
VRPRLQSGASARPLNFTVRSPARKPMRYWYSLGRSRWFGARLHVHVSVVVLIVVVALAAAESPAFAAVTLASFLGVILLHELGHAAVAHHFGYTVEGIWLAVIHGRCEFQAPDTQWEHSVISWGGIAAQLVVAVPIIALESMWHGSLGIFGPVVLILGYYSCVIAMFNLLPIKGLDGPLAWRIIPLARKRLEARRVVRSALGRSRRR